MLTHPPRLALCAQVYDVFHNLYAGCYLHLYQQWKARGLTIINFDEIKKETGKLAISKPGQLIKRLQAWKPGGGLAAEGIGEFTELG